MSFPSIINTANYDFMQSAFRTLYYNVYRKAVKAVTI